MKIQQVWQRLRQAGALMVGMPDYNKYVEHIKERHPELTPMTEAEFAVARVEARYGGGKIGKCPC